MPASRASPLGRRRPHGARRRSAPREHGVVGHVDRLHARAARDLHQQRLVVPDRVEARHRGEALEPAPVAEREGAHAGHERPPRRQRGHRLGDRAVEAQRVLRQLVQVRRLRGRAALEGVHVVGAHERQHHHHGAARRGRRRAGPRPSPRTRASRARPLRRRSRRPAAAGSGALASSAEHGFAALRLNCGSVPPASSSRMRQYLSTSSGCWSATSTSSSGSFLLS